jgi:ubiquinone/menaquinone biosynthesis C-methylase UbiE
MKDNFSSQSDNYAKYRPTYPLEFFDFLNSLLPSKMNAWDCGTGNGQIAFEISKTFENVEATDISIAQIKNAVTVDNVHYSIQAAESVNYENDFFDLIL